MDIVKIVDELFKNLTINSALAIGAFLISLYSLYLSKKSMNIRGMTRVRPVEFILNVNGNKSSIKLFNTGPGVAYDVQLQFYSHENMNIDPIIPWKIWYDDKLKYSLGEPDLQPNDSEIYQLKSDSFLSYNFHWPIIISYSLSSNHRIKTYWMYHMGETRVDKFLKLSKYQIFKYKFNRLYLSLRSPLIMFLSWKTFKKTEQDQKKEPLN